MVTLDEAGRDAPPLRAPSSASPLAPFVETAWIQGPTRTGPCGRRIVPDASPHLVVAATPGGRAWARLVGARTRFCDVPAGRTLTVGVRFRPGALPRLTGLPASDLTDGGLPLADVVGGAGAVTDAAAAGDGEGCLAAALALLARALRDAPPVDWRAAALGRAWHSPRRAPGVGELAREMGVGRRTLRATAAAEVGLSPAHWRRVRRVHVALARALEGGTPGGWAGVAAASGYHDQPHLVRDFRALLGETPTAFLARRDDVGRRATPVASGGGRP